MNMSIRRTYAIMLKLFSASLTKAKLFEDIYWTAMDILLMGMTGMWVQGIQSGAQPYALAMVTGAILWQVSLRAYLSVAVNILEEFWARNFVNLFSTPLKLSEWIVGAIIVGTARSLYVLFVGFFIGGLVYGHSILSIGLIIIPLYLLMLMFGLSLGLLGSSVLFEYGQKIQALIWALSWFFAPFCGVFYPMQVLPSWMQAIGYTMPATYVLESMRLFMYSGSISYTMLGKALCLNIIYLSLGLALFMYTFEKSREKGLSRLE